MAYITPLHHASSVDNAIKLQFMNPGEDCLVVAKSNRLEFYLPTPDGLSLQHAKAIYGKISVLQKVPRSHSSATDLLFVGTDRYAYFTLSWDPSTCQLHTEQKYLDIADPSLRDNQSGDRSWVDPSGKFLTMEIYEGIISVIPIAQEPLKRPSPSASRSSGTSEQREYLGEPLQTRIEELIVRSTAFLHHDPTKPPRIAILYENTQGKVKLKLRDLIYSRGIPGGEASAAEFRDVDDLYDDLELGADILVPVPLPLGGVLILGEKFIKYIDTVKNETITRPLENNTIFVAWEQLDNQRWLLADDYGRLFFFMLILNSANAVQSWKVGLLGETSRASALVHLGGGVVFLGSHQGDSHVIRITEGSFEIIQTLSNIGPILDFTVMDLGNRGETPTHEFSSGQARIVTGSGAFRDGSLRSVRSGVGMEDLGVLGAMEHITDLWGVSAFCPEGFCDTLLLSFVDESRVFHFSPDGEVEEKDDFLGLLLGEPTIHAANLPSRRILQVTEHGARVTDVESRMTLWEWSAVESRKITAASSNDRHLVLMVGGQKLMVFDIGDDIKMSSTKTFEADKQVSGVALTSSPIQACILCFPQSAEVTIIDLTDLNIRHTETLGEPGDAVPRSVLVACMFSDRAPTLFVAMADGSVFSFSLNVANYSLSDANKLVLGSEAPVFKLLPRADGLYNIFATCDHPSLIYASEDRIVYSAVNSDKATRICHFNAEAYPGAIAVATPDELKIALVDAERTTQIQTLMINETVRRTSYSSTERAFGLGTIQRTLVQNVEEVKSHFILADEIMFRQLSVFDLNPNELVECVIRTEHPGSNAQMGSSRPRDIFIVGTSVLDTPEEAEARTKGRILIFDVDTNRELRKICDFPVRGACRALAMINNKIVAALMKTVVVLNIKKGNLYNFEIEKEASYRTSTAPVDISVTGNIIAVADLMKSISLVEYHAGEGGQPDTLKEVARHYQTLWTTAAAPVAENEFLVADAEGNLVVLNRNTTGVTEDDRRRMQVTSELRLGEMVNRIHPMDLQTSPESPVIPKAFLATVDGSIYLFGLISPSAQDTLMRLQSALADFVASPGEIPFNKYRAFKSSVRQAEEPFRFVDGELIEQFLTFPPDIQEAVLARMDGGGRVNVIEIKDMIEGLKRMH
ncbi:hypothetical protein D8B26_004933 [Coccidioides posadasii str. Silveira]|uniref:DNA damage-binding protein 1 n=2 Tax=Coccidioides posadasii TaxID=199306 RepID=E9DJB1_COCPS|nr:CPSF A subunit region family protein [Coccidioides posadasii C735 delta SOWgp]EER24707.1 CPSF A subunit region family protein [Coccidioides posadasii C735 delta SOWgp]EFW13458.1 UV-damaged DNA binding protein [Coccidioides posadasii str. Silveira]QVM10273.1 hypothetical protein D8B26_004933 [Coccidioides posadasii str. Silveira]|eukprot:XP_003066852.1 CPSF A subunit region family protein [Coccidioides posadasii C735 delta SOWgp]